MAESSKQHEISLISRGLYRILSDVLGAECIVKLRRQQWDTVNLLNSCDTSDSYRITSGSRLEGFDFKSSDVDTMHIARNVSVLTKPTCFYAQQLQSPSIFVMENEDCSPGFTLIRCLTCDTDNEILYSSLVWKRKYMYLSSSAIVQTFLDSSIREVHSPCKAGNLLGIDADHAYTLKCPVWPGKTTPFVNRSIKQGWPPNDVLKAICGDGCLFVPINSRNQQCSDMMELEWRISFSLSEKKLFYSMNHCQFLCYGLLKMFLNEVLKGIPTVNDLLSSYFMKTAVFWEISDRPLGWLMETLLPKFWDVFRRLIRWVSIGYCPNFWIPENNMFYGKIWGENQRMLLAILSDIYSEGYRFLLRCPSLNESFSMIILQPYVVQMLSLNEEEYVCEAEVEREAFRVLLTFTSDCTKSDLQDIKMQLKNTINLNMESEEMTSAKRLRENGLLQQYAEMLLVSAIDSKVRSSNKKERYQSMKLAQTILRRTKTFFCSNYLNYAKYVYMTGNYSKTIEILHYIKHKLVSRPFMYWWRLDEDLIMATRQQGISYQQLIKSFVLSYVVMTKLASIEEIRSECHAIVEEIGGYLFIPPLVFINFLLVLSYTRLGENDRRHDVMFELTQLLCHDDGSHVFRIHKAISWEILGICQELCGGHHAALHSYVKALHDRHNFFKQATLARIACSTYGIWVRRNVI